MKRIVLGTDSWYPLVDGGTNVVKQYHIELSKNNIAAIIAPSAGKKKDIEGESKYYGRGVFHNRALKVPFLPFRNSAPGQDPKLKKFLNYFKPDILHAHSPFAILNFFNKYGKKHNIPVVFTFHSKFKDDIYRYTKSKFITWMIMTNIMGNIKKADYVWAVSKHAANVLHGYGYKGEIRVVYNSTDMKKVSIKQHEKFKKQVNRWHDLSPDEVVFIYAGRIVKNKNIKFSIDVINELKKRNFKCKFLVLGDGDDAKYFKEYVENLNLENEVIFTGRILDRKKISAYLSRADLLLMPSRYDMHSLVVLEAAACSTPTMAASNTSYDEVIKHKKTGYIRDLIVEDWADCIQTIFKTKNINKVKKNCSSIMSNWKENINNVSKLYDEIIKDYKEKKKYNI